jgi:G3E family GTPase
MPSPHRTSSTPRHLGVTLVAGQQPDQVARVAAALASPRSLRTTVGPDVHEAADEVHEHALALAREGSPVDVTAALLPGTPARPVGLLLGALLDSALGLPDGRSLLSHVVSVISAADLAELVLRGVDDRFAAAEHVIDLVEYATIVVLTDTGALRPGERNVLARLLAALAPEAEVRTIGSLRPRTPGPRGGASRLGATAGWMQALADDAPDHADDGTLTTVVYRDERPFHPERLAEVVERAFVPGGAVGPGGDSGATSVGTVLRSRGFVQFATRADRVGSWSSVGQMLSLDPTAQPSWHPDAPHGQQIAFFGLGLDAALIRTSLDSCLLTDAELLSDPSTWSAFRDPFPIWTGQGRGPGAGSEHDHRR